MFCDWGLSIKDIVRWWGSGKRPKTAKWVCVRGSGEMLCLGCELRCAVVVQQDVLQGYGVCTALCWVGLGGVGCSGGWIKICCNIGMGCAAWLG